jgi:DNA-directed RNA polymerase delta subunit
MNTEFGFLSGKLSAPIEYLKLDNRAYHMLKRAQIHRVSQIIVAGKVNILSIKNIGPLMVERIFDSMSKYLDIPSKELSSDRIKQKAVLEENKSIENPFEKSITALNLPRRVMDLLQEKDIFSINQLIEFQKNNLNDDSRFGRFESQAINNAIWAFTNSIKEVHHRKTTQITPSKYILDNRKKTVLRDLNLVIKLLGLRERSWFIIGLRSVKLLTLEEIAKQIGGVTRERVRQIIKDSSEKIYNKLRLLVFFLNIFEEHSKPVQKRLTNNRFTIPVLAEAYRQQLSTSDLTATNESIEKLITIIRLGVISSQPWGNYKDFTFLSCLAKPSIEKHAKVHQIREQEKKEQKILSYKDIAYLVLSEAKRPLHWRDIAEKAYKLNKKDQFETRSIYHTLLAHKNHFVRVGQGTYELVEWGNKQAEPYTEIIASILKKENYALSFEAIFAKVTTVRKIKQQTLSMYLDMHPRFYRSINNMYGLRGWLPPRERQNLRTPEWLVEDTRSLERVDKAILRGYDVTKIISNDELGNPA